MNPAEYYVSAHSCGRGRALLIRSRLFLVLTAVTGVLMKCACAQTNGQINRPKQYSYLDYNQFFWRQILEHIDGSVTCNTVVFKLEKETFNMHTEPFKEKLLTYTGVATCER